MSIKKAFFKLLIGAHWALKGEKSANNRSDPFKSKTKQKCGNTDTIGLETHTAALSPVGPSERYFAS